LDERRIAHRHLPSFEYGRLFFLLLKWSADQASKFLLREILMGLSAYIYDVSEATFESDVILKSHDIPVVVDFWAPWCGPCKVLGPLLERFAIESGGGFILAKINVDENPNLSIRYGVQGIPAVKAFLNGEVHTQFTGAQPEPLVRRFLDHLVPNESDQAVSQAQSLLATRHWVDAEEAYRDIFSQDAGNSAAALGLVKSLLMQGVGHESSEILDVFPAGQEWAAAERLKPIAQFLAEAESMEITTEEDVHSAAYYQAARLISRGNMAAAMDGMLDILRQDKTYRKGAPKSILLALFELLGDEDPLTREYRDELASILF
jgi:putative thioredoxin